MENFELVVIGGGLASARAIRAYREAGGEGRIALVSRDAVVPYHRPPLSKRYLRGEQEAEAAFVEPESFYAESGVELLLETAATAVRPGERRVELDGGRTVTYRKLLLATGATPRTLPVPGADLDGVFTLRTLADATTIREAASHGGRAVSVGGSFIGMETAASLRTLGLDVTLVELAERLFPVLESDEVSDGLVELYRDKGVDVVLGDSVAAFRGAGRLEEVETAAGRTIPADLAVVGIGVVPNAEFLEGSGIEVENGVVVDDRFRASAPDVWAVGDVANFDDPVLGRRHRIEHWSNANYQGTEVGKALAGEDARYDAVASFFTEVFGTVVKVFGDTVHDRIEVTGSLDGGKLLACYCEGDRIRGCVVTGQDEEAEETLKRLIRGRGPVDEALAAAG